MDLAEKRMWAISPLDGRYEAKVGFLKPLCSEGALIAYRIHVELSWLLHLGKLVSSGVLDLPWRVEPADLKIIEKLLEASHTQAVIQVKELEKSTNHDVKAVEYYLRERLRAEGVQTSTLAMIHFACTSEDINNVAYSLMLKAIHEQHILPTIQCVLQVLAQKARLYQNHALLSRTHGQAATPTTMGKELAVFGSRMNTIYKRLQACQFASKFNGAVGNYNAHCAVLPDAKWEDISQDFIENRLGLSWNGMTTQIENHDSIVFWCSALHHYQSVAIGLTNDLWAYISKGHFKQKMREGEVGSSTMPHKVNPIDFENAEGNFGLANSLSEYFSKKLPISRLQRDLSDSTVLRSLGSMTAYHLLAQNSLLQGLEKLEINAKSLALELNSAVEILTEPVQTMMRANGLVDAYEILKEASRGKEFTVEHLHQIIDGCSELPDAAKESLKKLQPQNYLGRAAYLAEGFAREVLGS